MSTSATSTLKATEQYACPICTSETVLFHTDKKRAYHKCQNCFFVFVPPLFHLSQEEEKAVYDLHENTPGDTGYEKFLSRATKPVIEYFYKDDTPVASQAPIKGLDFGCGPSPVLADMLHRSNRQFAVDPYDLYYFPQNSNCLTRICYYEFITATEVIEHIQNPLAVLRQLWRCLQPCGGMLLIMTKRVEGSIERFRNWHYTRDPTHISFFHENTFAWLAQNLATDSETCELRIVGPDVVMFVKQTTMKSIESTGKEELLNGGAPL